MFAPYFAKKMFISACRIPFVAVWLVGSPLRKARNAAVMSNDVVVHLPKKVGI